jgi:diacylglycerol kinase
MMESPDDNDIVMSTMKIDPDEFSPIRTTSRYQAFLFSLAGIFYLIRRQRSIQGLTLVTIICLILGVWLEVSLALLIEMIVIIGIVWITEALNTAIEAAVDVATQELHPMAKVSKDVAAGAALIATFLATIVTLMILVPPLVARLRG